MKYSSLFSLLILLISAFFARFAPAQERPILSWETVVSRAEQHPGLLAAQSETEAAQGEVGIARQYPNPDLSVTIGRGRDVEGSGSKVVWGLEMAVPLEWVMLRSYRRKAAQAGVDIAELKEQATRLSAIREWRLLYLDIAYDQALAAALDGSLSDLQNLVETVRLRVEKGEARSIELIRVESEFAEAEMESEKAKEEALANRKRVAIWLGPEIPPDFRVELRFEEPPPLPELDEIVSRALVDYPLIKAVKARLQQVEAQVKVEQHTAFPNVSLGGFYDQDFDARAWGGMLNISLPLWNLNLYGVAKAKAERQKTVREIKLAEKQLEDEIIRLNGKAKATLRSIQKYAEVILPKSAEVLRSLEQSYAVGETSLIDILDARRQSARTNTAYLNLLAEYRALWTELNTLMGDVNHV